MGISTIDINNFLLQSVFGGLNDQYQLSANRAYRDFCRTLRSKDDSTSLQKARRLAQGILISETKRMLDKNIEDQKNFDAWHKKTCQKIKSTYLSMGLLMTFGQAQKWVNMTLKYLCVFGLPEIGNADTLFHAPIDSYVFDVAERTLQINPPCKAWSKLDDYALYIAHQNSIREKSQLPPLHWEIRAWNEEASSKSGRQS